MAALFVNCSVNEGMSNSVLEAIQQGTPILLSNITANRDLGLPDDFYFDPASPTELSKKIARALETPSDFLADRESFDDWDEVVNKYRRYRVCRDEPVCAMRMILVLSFGGSLRIWHEQGLLSREIEIYLQYLCERNCRSSLHLLVCAR